MVELYDQMGRNKWYSLLLMLIVFFIVFATIAAFSYIFDFGFLGAIFAFLFSIFYAIGGYYFSDKVVLSVSGAKPARKKDYPHLYNTVEGLAIAAGLPIPRVYVIDDPAPNAFATGRDPEHSVIAVTTGLLDIMNRSELEGVIAHEMSHIKNYDIRFATLAVVLVGMVGIIGNIAFRSLFFSGSGRKGGHPAIFIIALLFIVFAPIAAHLVRFAISRKREFLADATGAHLCKYPEGLASALEKLKKHGTKVKTASDVTAPLFIANPLKGSLTGLFSTHPPLDERIKALRKM